MYKLSFTHHNMEFLLLAVLLAHAWLLLSHTEAADNNRVQNSSQRQLLKYKTQIKITQKMLERECPSYSRVNKNVNDKEIVDLDKLKVLYDRLFKTLIECRSNKSQTNGKSVCLISFVSDR